MNKAKPHRNTGLLRVAISGAEAALHDFKSRCEYNAADSRSLEEEAREQMHTLRQFKAKLRRIAYFIDVQLGKTK